MSMVKVMKIDEWLEKKSIEKDAIIFKDQNWTFSHLKELITKTSLFLQNECQLKVGDRFCYYGTNNPEQIVLLFAASKIELYSIMNRVFLFGISKIFNFAETIIPNVPSEPIIILCDSLFDVTFFN